MMNFTVHCQLGEGPLKIFEIQSNIPTTGVHFNDHEVTADWDCLTTSVSQSLGLLRDCFYLTHNGKLLSDCASQSIIDNHDVPLVVVPRLLAGKGGFGSMLRAIGAQIEKTTNREACRDLSGRRLRDINEEQRLKKWFAKQKEREQEKEEAKKKKLEKLRQFCEGAPLPLTQDPEYNRQRAEMADSVFEAVDKGFEAAITEIGSAEKASTSSAIPANDEASSSSSSTSSSVEVNTTSAVTASTSSSLTKKADDQPKEKPVTIKRTFFEEDLDSDVSDSDSDQETSAKKAKV